MLTHYRSEEEPQPDGSIRFWITDELEEDPCERCGGESVPNICESCEKYHHHGRVHPLEEHVPMALCRMCAELDAAAWIARRQELGR
jgi:hypothetical protein